MIGNKQIQKKFKYILAAATVFINIAAATGLAGQVYAQSAGCPGSTQQGPPSAGTVCPDGTVFNDPTLPLGCPGSTKVGPPPANYTVVCPARPGRAECTYSLANNTCATSTTGGTNTSGTAGNSGSNAIQGTCKNEDISKDCPIVTRLVEFINVLAGLVGIIIVLMITFRGIQYTFSRENAQETAKAKDGIRDAVFALVFFLFVYAILQWLVPGGIL
jgi:hypothetical protein